jgi:hypothetical protein
MFVGEQSAASGKLSPSDFGPECVAPTVRGSVGLELVKIQRL